MSVPLADKEGGGSKLQIFLGRHIWKIPYGALRGRKTDGGGIDAKIKVPIRKGARMEGKKRSKEGKGRVGMDGWRFYAIGQQNCLQMALSFFDKDHIENLLCVRVPFLSSDDRNYQALGW